MYDEEYDNDIGMSDDGLPYREMNPEDPWNMGLSEDNVLFDNDEIDNDEFDKYCLQPAISRRGIIKEQCHFIDSEFNTTMPNFWIK